MRLWPSDVYDRLAPLLKKGENLIPESFEEHYGVGFLGRGSVRLQVRIVGPARWDETYIDVTRSSAEEALKAIEEMLQR